MESSSLNPTFWRADHVVDEAGPNTILPSDKSMHQLFKISGEMHLKSRKWTHLL